MAAGARLIGMEYHARSAHGRRRTLLGWIPGVAAAPVESSCCDMAGSFGYESEHYATSLAMAELSPLPAMRATQAAGDALVVVDGTNCHHQNADAQARRRCASLRFSRALDVALTRAR
ncbi:hypothetical protein PWR63_33450 [Paraburkholderia sp. A2WS-5]|uniref:hypothetical protein n=1 Tax=unclassified Paraburkholderia TaxID=2615204 RepID=UPI003B769E17